MTSYYNILPDEELKKIPEYNELNRLYKKYYDDVKLIDLKKFFSAYKLIDIYKNKFEYVKYSNDLKFYKNKISRFISNEIDYLNKFNYEHNPVVFFDSYKKISNKINEIIEEIQLITFDFDDDCSSKNGDMIIVKEYTRKTDINNYSNLVQKYISEKDINEEFWKRVSLSSDYYVISAIISAIKKTGINEFSNVKELASGTYGTVSRISTLNHDFTMIKKIANTKTIDMFFEYIIGRKCLNPTRILIPTFMATYTYDNELYLAEHIKGRTLYSKEFTKTIPYNPDDDEYKKLKNSIYSEILLQIACALYVAQNTCAFTHFDLSINNVMIDVLDSPQIIQFPIISDRLYIVKITTKYRVKIIDFGMAHMTIDIDDLYGTDLGILNASDGRNSYNSFIYQNIIVPNFDFIKILHHMITFINGNEIEIIKELYNMFLLDSKNDETMIINIYGNISPISDIAHRVPTDYIRHGIFKKYSPDNIQYIDVDSTDKLIDSDIIFKGPGSYLKPDGSLNKFDVEYYINRAKKYLAKRYKYPYMILIYMQIIRSIMNIDKTVEDIYNKLIESLKEYITYPTQKILDELKQIEESSIKLKDIKENKVMEYQKFQTKLYDLLSKTIGMASDTRSKVYKHVALLLLRYNITCRDYYDLFEKIKILSLKNE